MVDGLFTNDSNMKKRRTSESLEKYHSAQFVKIDDNKKI